MSYAENEFPKDYAPKVFDNKTVNIMVDGKPVSLEFSDTATDGDYDKLRRECYEQIADVFVVCFDVTNRESFKSIKKKWIPEITEHKPGTPYIIVGCKAELKDHEGSYEEANQMAKTLGAKGYCSCSAYTQENLKRVFDSSVQATF